MADTEKSLKDRLLERHAEFLAAPARGRLPLLRTKAGDTELLLDAAIAVAELDALRAGASVDTRLKETVKPGADRPGVLAANPTGDCGTAREAPDSSNPDKAGVSSHAPSTLIVAGWIVTNAAGNKFRCWEMGMTAWTTDIEKAARYARRVDAESVHAEDEDAWRIVPFTGETAREEVVREDIAKIVYAAMKWAAEHAENGRPPAWVDRGNSTAQVEARRFARDLVPLVRAPAIVRRVRHLKRNSVYEVLGEAQAQVSTGADGKPIGLGLVRQRSLVENAKVTVYRDPHEGRLFVRFPDEFEDGRFVTITKEEGK